MSAGQPWGEAAVLARTTARVLSLASWIAGFALALTLAALAALASGAALAPGWLVAAALGAAAFYYALRARVDERLFGDIADALASGIDDSVAMRTLDTSLADLGIGSAASMRRPLAQRAKAALRLLRRAAVLAIAALVLSALLWLLAPSR